MVCILFMVKSFQILSILFIYYSIGQGKKKKRKKATTEEKATQNLCAIALDCPKENVTLTLSNLHSRTHIHQMPQNILDRTKIGI